MEMVSTITSLITNVVNFAGGLLLLFGAVTLLSIVTAISLAIKSARQCICGA